MRDGKSYTTGQLQKDRIKQTTRIGEKHFDVYAVPLKAIDDKKYVAEILLDRTEEVLLQEQHEKDMSTLVKLLSGLLNDFQKEGKILKSLVDITVSIARILHLPEDRIKDIEIAASLCNIGMISMGTEGLNLSPEEIHLKHAEKSWNILHRLSGFEHIKDIILHHHEYYDGSGFPDGQKGRTIPLGARIIAIAEELYYQGRTTLTYENILALQPLSGTIFDPGIIEELLFHLKAK